ncbi:pyridoxal phosphate-dependent transferase [Polychytrium aggregatum]|uniref:pyridoxal phosphate-dependent transferase n=1 Tax=Polychytrium aggregatum TaxID=110093 RepID=UPI0022FDCBAE|nr:pyridoxal phosphate-dependent transferase [Polychytrium aggregatum]KAI9199525.1 pyridoxal phosphate-dependent transferase [Polychytrium aggregatum]
MPISARALRAVNTPNLLVAAFERVSRNPFHVEHNRGGIINLGTAENEVMHPTLVSELNSPQIQAGGINASHLTYGSSFNGSRALRSEISHLLNRKLNLHHKLNDSNMKIVNGATTAISVFSMILCDAGEGVMIPSPYYGGFHPDCSVGTDSVPIRVPAYASNGFQITTADLERSYAESKGRGIVPKVLLICNPNNPLGQTYSRTQLMEMLLFAQSHDMEVISDEVYALTIREGDDNLPPFTSVYAMSDLPDPQRTHLIWSMSKDFGVSGMRLATVISLNPDVIAAAGCFGTFASTPNYIQHLWTNFLRDRPRVDQFLDESNLRIKDSYDKVAGFLQSHHIPFLPANAGFFVWVNLSKWLGPESSEAGAGSRVAWTPSSPFARYEPSPRETQLWMELLDEGVYIAYGAAFFADEEGWFRILFAKDWSIMQLALERIGRVLSRREAQHQ